MSPIPNPRTLGEVGIYLRDFSNDIAEIKRDFADDIVEIKRDINTIKRNQETVAQAREARRQQFLFTILSSIISPVIVGFLLIAIKGSGVN